MFASEMRRIARSLKNAPGPFVIAVATAAVGIGVSTSVLSVANTVLFHSFGYADPGRLVGIRGTDASGQQTGLSLVDFDLLARHTKTLESLGIFEMVPMTLATSHGVANVFGELVSRDCFRTLGAAPAFGRLFYPPDFDASRSDVALLSYTLWSRSFERNSNIIGQEVLINNRLYTVIGVMPSDFAFSRPEIQLWAPWRPTAAELSDETARDYTVIARLVPNRSRADASRELVSLSRGMPRQSPDRGGMPRMVLTGPNDHFLGDIRPTLLLLLAAAFSVLLVATMNLSQLQMARGLTRTNELAVRLALGATRARIALHLITDSLIIAALGGALGILFAISALKYLVAMLPVRPLMPRLDQAHLDGPVLLAAIFITLVTGLLFGILPAAKLSGMRLEAYLREGGRGSLQGSWMKRFNSLLIMFQVATSVILVLAAGLMLRSLNAMLGVQPGFRSDHILTIDLPSRSWELSAPDAETLRHRMEVMSAVLGRVRSTPGVESAALVTVLPLGRLQTQARVYVEGRGARLKDGVDVPYRAVSGDYFTLMGIPLIAGRIIADADVRTSRLVAVVNETMSKRFWPGQNPIGRLVSLVSPVSGPWLTVVGVVGDVRFDSLVTPPDAELYASYKQTLVYPEAMTVVARTRSDPMLFSLSLQKAIRATDSEQPLGAVEAMRQVVLDSVARPRFYALLLIVFALSALVLATAGIVAIVSRTVTAMTRELGVRMALGATPSRIVRQVTNRVLLDVVVGVIAGLLIGRLLTRFLTSELYEVSPGDPLSILIAACIMVGISAMAVYIPARRISDLDPLNAMR